MESSWGFSSGASSSWLIYVSHSIHTGREHARREGKDGQPTPEIVLTRMTRKEWAARRSMTIYFGDCAGAFSLVGGTIPLSRM
jgi:hypothetical protein